MKTIVKVISTLAAISFITGCATLDPIQSMDDQSIEEGLSQQEVKEAINRGAKAARWTTEDKGTQNITFNTDVWLLTRSLR